MTIIKIPTQSVVLILGGRHAPFAEVADLVPSKAEPWDVNKPDESLARLHAALSDTGSARVVFQRSHPKGRKAIASAAHRHGAQCIAVLLPGAEDINAGDEKIDAVYTVSSPEGLSFEIVPMPSNLDI